VNLPPLRQRVEDILPLAEHFAVNMVRELEREFFPGFTEECRRSLQTYAWPGNVRGLKNAVERSVYRSDDPEAPIDRIVFDPFTTSIWQPEGDAPAASAVLAEPMPEKKSVDAPVPADLKSRVAALEKQLIDDAMRAARYRQPRAAELLGLSYNQLRSLLKKHKLVARYGRGRNQAQTSGARH
jgi:psp operon transcriptional activator